MNDYGTLNDKVDEKARALIDAYVTTPTAQFDEDVRFLGLNPSTDFMHSDLSNVSFGASDLRGFDFTGADLSGCTGLGAQWDETTVFSDANVVGSIFAYAKHSQDFFFENPKWQNELNRLSKTHWARSIIWVADHIAPNRSARAEAIEVSKAYFEHSTDAAVRSNILFFLNDAFDSKTEHRDFLIHIMNKHSDDPKIVKPAVVVLSSLFSRDKFVVNILYELIQDQTQNNGVRRMALRGVINSPSYSLALDFILDDEALYAADLRQLYTRRFASRRGKFAVNACTQARGNRCFDFLEVITREKIIMTARRIHVQASAALQSSLKRGSTSTVNLDVDFHRMMILAVDIKEVLQKLREDGLPLQFASDVEHLVRQVSYPPPGQAGKAFSKPRATHLRRS